MLLARPAGGAAAPTLTSALTLTLALTPTPNLNLLKEKKRAAKAAQPLQPLQPPSKRKRAEGAQGDAPEDGPAPDDEPAARPDGAPAEGEKRTRRKKRPTATATDTATDTAGAEQHGQSAVCAVPQLGSCASSGHAWRLSWRIFGEAGPLGAQPLPRVLEPAASKAADFPAFDHSGGAGGRGRA